MYFYVDDHKLDTVREILNKKADILEIVPVKDALDKIHPTVNDIYENVVAREDEAAKRICQAISAEDVADLVLCAAHLMKVGDVHQAEVERAIERNLNSNYGAETPSKNKSEETDSKNSNAKSDDYEALNLLINLIFGAGDASKRNWSK